MSDASYDLRSVDLPRLAGLPLRLVVAWAEGPLRGLLTPRLFRDAGITRFRGRTFDEAPTFYPLYPGHDPRHPAPRIPLQDLPAAPLAPGPGHRFPGIHDYARAFRQGSEHPQAIAQRALEAIAASDREDPPLRAMLAVDPDDVLRQAAESAARLGSGEPRSLLEGVPIAVKDEVDMRPFPTTLGTRFLRRPAAADSAVVERLRQAGAVLLGKSNMHEIGIGVTGLNPHHGTARNPYDPGRHTGGSSSGSAAAVAAGLCPAAIGADGGGSIRIPAALCGLVGLKPTFGRVSEHGAAPLGWSVAHLGPIAASVTDAALLWAVIAGPDEREPHSLMQPPPSLEGWQDTDLTGLTLGIYRPWFEHAEGEVVAACEELLEVFRNRGAELRQVEVPDLDTARVAQVISIAAEMSQSLDRYHAGHRRDYGLDVRMNLALARAFGARDYLRAQQVRTRMMRYLKRVFSEVDLLLTPATGIPAPPVFEAGLAAGGSDLATLTEIMRFAFLANLTGLPAIAFPAGYTRDGLPIGMQAMAGPWDEVRLLRLAAAAERSVERRRPRVFHSLLEL